MKQVELIPTSQPVRSLFTEFGLGVLTPKSKARKSRKRPSCEPAAPARVFTPADAQDLSMFGYDYSI